METFDDIRHQWPNDIGKKRDHKKCQHDEEDYVIVPFGFGNCCHLDFYENYDYFKNDIRYKVFCYLNRKFYPIPFLGDRDQNGCIKNPIAITNTAPITFNHKNEITSAL